MIMGNFQDSNFLSGFSNWKAGTQCFTRHECTSAHKAATDIMVTIPSTTCDVGSMLSSTNTQQQASNRQYLLKVAQC